ncbi:MAG: N-acetylneuraminate synthase family protein [Candidatus Pacearchaeota archaeon]|jgi:N-acetylneuraminate synthase
MVDEINEAGLEEKLLDLRKNLLNNPQENYNHVLIENHYIGQGHPIFITAEIGINHNGSLDQAKQMIDMSKRAGCDAVKFQKRTIDIVYSPEELATPRESKFGKTNGDLKRGLEFNEDQYRELMDYSRDKGIIFYASPWDIPSVDLLERLNVPCHKIASACLTDGDLLKRVHDTGKPVILSTGLSSQRQIEKAVDILGPDNLILMQCTGTYPTNPDEVNLLAMNKLREFGSPVGYSGHENGIYASVGAALLGADTLERHVTLDKTMWGSDQKASIEESALTNMKYLSSKIRYDNDGVFLLKNYLGDEFYNLAPALGDGNKRVYDREVPVRAKLRKVDTLGVE